MSRVFVGFILFLHKGGGQGFLVCFLSKAQPHHKTVF